MTFRGGALHAACAAAVLAVGCNQVLGLDELSVLAEPDAGLRECSRHSDCERSEEDGPVLCIEPEGRCAPVLSEDCRTITGDATADDAIVIGSLLLEPTMTAGDLQANAVLAVEQINAAGGVPRVGSDGHGRPLVLVSCNESGHARRAASHLVNDLAVPAIVGPTTTQNALDLTNHVTAGAGTLLISPTAMGSSLADVIDQGLTWQMVPTEVQRAPLMIQQINELEASIRKETGREQIKLGVAFRNDSLGIGTRAALNTLILNDRPLADPANLNVNIQLKPYDASAPDQAGLVADYLRFAPDIIVLAGTGEAVTEIMLPLERKWSGERRPVYVLLDASRIDALLTAVREDPDLRARVRGIGIAPSAESAAVYDALVLDYNIRYPNGTPTLPNAAPAYDAVFAVAYAIAATEQTPITGATVAAGLGRLGSGPSVEITSTKILAAFRQLTQGESVSAIGTFGSLRWNDDGTIATGRIEVWCVGAVGMTPVYRSSGLSYDLASGRVEGAYTPCGR